MAVAVVTKEQRRSAVRDALRSAAETRGIDPNWLEALGENESGLDGRKPNLTGPDLERGGSYGPTQISARTARAFGFTGPMESLSDPVTAADLTADMVAAGFAERSKGSYDNQAGVAPPFKPVRYGPPGSFRDMLAVWNAGRPYAQLPAGGSTIAEYVPRAERYLERLA